MNSSSRNRKIERKLGELSIFEHKEHVVELGGCSARHEDGKKNK